MATASDTTTCKGKSNCGDEESLLESGPTFTPRVSQQRYTFVKDLIRSYKSKKVIDMGCGECQLIVKLKREMCIEQLAGVDINRNFVEASKHLIQPLLYEFIHGREAPLEATLYHGSIAECDSRLVRWDFLACVEVIEHLEDDILQRVPEVIFGFLKPTVVVMTTPNKDFNVLFPGTEDKLRHWDHKFEWTRQEFQDWGDNINTKYGYNVRYTGVGKGPDGTEHLGTCTQIAVFEQLETQLENLCTDKQEKEPYDVVKHSIYPYKPDTKTAQDKVLLEVEYIINKLSLDASMRMTGDDMEMIKGHEEKEDQDYKVEEEDNDDDIVEGQFDDADEDDLCCDFMNSFNSNTMCSRTHEINIANTRLYEEENGNVMFEVPVSRLMEFDGLQKICTSVDILRSALKSSKKFSLTSDELSVLYQLPDDDNSYSLLADDETNYQEVEKDVDKGLDKLQGDLMPEELWD